MTGQDSSNCLNSSLYYSFWGIIKKSSKAASGCQMGLGKFFSNYSILPPLPTSQMTRHALTSRAAGKGMAKRLPAGWRFPGRASPRLAPQRGQTRGWGRSCGARAAPPEGAPGRQPPAGQGRASGKGPQSPPALCFPTTSKQAKDPIPARFALRSFSHKLAASF